MSPDEVRALSDTEIERLIRRGKEELFNLRFQKASGQLENVMRMNRVRREIARYKTILREKQLAAELLQKESGNAE